MCSNPVTTESKNPNTNQTINDIIKQTKTPSTPAESESISVAVDERGLQVPAAGGVQQSAAARRRRAPAADALDAVDVVSRLEERRHRRLPSHGVAARPPRRPAEAVAPQGPGRPPLPPAPISVRSLTNLIDFHRVSLHLVAFQEFDEIEEVPSVVHSPSSFLGTLHCSNRC